MGYSVYTLGMGFCVWCIFIVLGFLLLYFLKSHTRGYASAQDILDQRYINGEIDIEEYEEKSNMLKRIG